MSDKVPVVFEGKEYPIDAAIAADDDKLRQVLSPFCNLKDKTALMES
jgi:hypothetical protein